MISYGIGYTPAAAAATSVKISMPPLYAAGDFLVMAVTAGGATASVVSATAPSGWTALSGSGTAPSVFYRTATGTEPSSYTVTLGASATASGFIAAYPAVTLASSAFRSSAASVTSYSPAFPSGVTGSQTVLLIAAAVSTSTNVLEGVYGCQNINLPPSWTTEVPVFGQAMPANTPAVLPCAVGMCDIAGSAGTPVLTSPVDCQIFAAYLVLNITGTPPAAPYTVTATSDGPTAALGAALTVKALTGADTAQYIFANGAYNNLTANGVNLPPSIPITPVASGSLVYGAVTENTNGVSAVPYTADANTTFSQNIADTLNVCIYGTFRGTAATTAGTPVTLGGSAPDNNFWTAAVAEVLAAPGKTLAETATATASATVAGAFSTTSLALPASFASQPAPGTLLVAMVSANSGFGNGNAAFTITDTLGLTWYLGDQQSYPSYSGVWFATVPQPPSSYVIEDEASGSVLDEGGSQVYDESGPGNTSVFRSPNKAVAGKARVRKGTAAGSPGAPYVFVPVVVAPFTQPNRAVSGRPSAHRGTSAAENLGAAYVFVPVYAAPFTQPSQAVPAHPAARHGTSAGSSGAPYAFVPPSHTYDILDESGSAVFDEAGGNVYDESGPGPAPGSPAWSAARAGLSGDESAVNWASQVSQFLTTHGIVPVYSGSRIWTVAQPAAAFNGSFAWLDSTTAGWLPDALVSQPFALPPGSTAVGRVQVPVTASGNGADLQVTLCPDNGSGSPQLSSPLASVTVPASHVAALSANGSLAAAGPLATAQFNTAFLGAPGTGPWAQPAVSANGAGSYATPATSGGFTALIGGYDATANAASGYTAVIASQGASVSGGVTQPALPQAAYYTCAAITTDSVVVAGGRNNTTGFATVWTASWDAGTGTIGSWSAQQALPAAVVYGAMASWGTTVYVIGGSPAGAASGAVSSVWTASSASGQVSAWTAAPPLPVKLQQAYAAVIGNWLVVAGGLGTSGTAVASTWYSAINADGSLAGWQQGPALPLAVFAFGPGWNTVATDSALAIVSGTATTPATSPYTQVLAVSPDGPAPAWQLQNWGGSVFGVFQCAAYPAAGPGQWQAFNLHLSSYDTALMSPVPLLSVPLPVSGLTPGATYHVVLRQAGGSDTDSLALGAMASSGTGWLWQAKAGGAWTPNPGQQVAVNVFDQAPGGSVLHLVQDAGAGVTTLAWQGASGLLNGVLESAVFPPGSPQATLPSVVQVTYGTGGVPTGLVQLT